MSTEIELNKELLMQRVEEKLVSVQKHPVAELYIYNYSPKVQFDKLWDEVTRQTRGLILDAEMNIIAKPFGKFFNIEEHSPDELPVMGFDVFDKLDGSLGILYWLDDKPYIATRGSFDSEQARHANNVLYSNYEHLFGKLNKGKTYLFEIIYPENRIVVDYGATDDLFLLTVIDNNTGEESIDDIGFPVVKQYSGVNQLEELKALEEDNKEGFVVRFKNNFRVKMKFAEYVRLHRIVTGVSNIAIWEYMRDGKSFEELLQRVPDEFYDWLHKTKDDIISKYNAILDNAQEVYPTIYDTDKKTFALRVLDKHKDISGILFNMWSGKNIEPIIWKMVRPTFSKPFKKEI